MNNGLYTGVGGGLIQGIGIGDNNGIHNGLYSNEPTKFLILDKVKNIPVALSLRKLNSLYVGPAIRVRRSSDNALLDISFDGNKLDTSAILSFCGNDNGFVRRIYNQGVLGGFLESQSNTRDPQIVSNGQIITENGLPTLVFNGSNVLFTLGSFNLFQNKSSGSIYSVYRWTTVPTSLALVFYINIFAGGGFASSGARFAQGGGGVSGRSTVQGRRLDADATQSHSGNITLNTTSVILNTSQIDWQDSNTYIYINKNLDSSNMSFLTNGNTENATSRGFSLGGIEAGTLVNNPSLIRWQETIVTEHIDNRQFIENNIKAYYKIY